MSGKIVFEIFYIIQYLFVFVIFVRLLMDNRPPEVLFAWTLILLVIPLVGIIFYFFFGIDWRKHRIMKRLPEEIVYNRESSLLAKQEAFLNLSIGKEEDNDAKKSMHLLLMANHCPITSFNSVRFFFDGREYFDDIISQVKDATRSIHMQFYIWRSDDFGSQLIDLLCAKARENLQVALIFDGIGCLFKISKNDKRKMKESGVRFSYFMNPSEKLNNFFVNYRNHRKIIVIDDKVAYTGGFNIGDEYIDGGKKFKYWRDSAVKVEGESVPYFKDIIEAAWEHSGGEPLIESHPSLSPGVSTVLQVASSGPDSQWHVIEKLFINLIMNANEKVYIQSPYFIPDRSMQNVLETAALSGIDVRLMVTGIPDKKIPYWVAETYFEPLVRAGVKIYRYQKGFLHAKTIVVDELISSVGSCNFDIRSFRLAYETNVVIYDPHKAKELQEKFESDMADCRFINEKNLRRYSFLRRLRNSIARIFAPIL